MILNNSIIGFNTEEHNVDFCVVGGGIAGMFAALAAARHGAKVAIMQDRPMFGGNASSEIRMWIRGAHGNKETGLLEELSLLNIYRNPTMHYSIWDTVLYEMLSENNNITTILNCSCCNAEMDGDKIKSITGWQTTTQKWQKVNAKIFADCSGDSVLAPITGAEFRMGRESSKEFNEDIAPEISDNYTMGMSCLFQVRETLSKSKYVPPSWANKYTKNDFPYRIDFNNKKSWQTDNYWWIEIGGVHNSIDDTEKMRDELLKIVYGVWDFIKNSGELDADNWELEWAGILPGKRESRRYVGDYILNQNDVRAEGRFDDLVAYGGWSMDDHNPKGFETREAPTTYHQAPSPFGIPYRTMYSKNIQNLMFAGRNISCTHSAMSSSRVMGTCGIIGQAVGTAAAIAINNDLTPRRIYTEKINELKQTLMEDDCFLPFNKREMTPVMEKAEITQKVLFNGLDRGDNAWEGELGDEILINFKEATYVNWIEFIFDSDLERHCYDGQKWYKKDFVMKFNIYLDDQPLTMPDVLIRDMDIYICDEKGNWHKACEIKDNYKRLFRLNIDSKVNKIKAVPTKTWGSKKARIYSCHIK